MRWVGMVLLLFMFGSQLSSARHTSPTYDEYVYISRGYTYLKTDDTQLKVRHPILLDVAAAIPLLLMPDLHLSLDHLARSDGNLYWYAYTFLWEANADQAEQIVFLARLPTMMLSLLLAVGVFRWAHERSGSVAGLLAMALCTFDPNILAHSRLVTPDVGQTTFMFLALLSWWRYLQQPGWVRWAIAGITLGLAQTAGFPALILFPVLTIVSTFQGWSVGQLKGVSRLLVALVGASGLSALTVWAVYGFHWGPVETLGLSLPAPYHWEEFIALTQRLGRQDLAFCCGRVYRGGWWLFFVVALLTKTPLPTLTMFGLGMLVIVRCRTWVKDVALWLFPALYYGNALASSLNIGYRHILPILPFLFVIAGQSVQLAKSRWRQVGMGGLLGWLILTSIAIHPFYLAYFNELVGGPLGGRRHLVVSDLDWGQDLPGLSAYLKEHNIEEIYLSWFGTTPPTHYGIHYQPLPAWPPMGDPLQLPFHPEYPLPGTYAISAANLEGARLADPTTFAWFKSQQPEAHIGYSIFIYQVPRRLDPGALPANILLSSVSLADLPASVIENQLHTNDMRPRWFDARRAMILPTDPALMLVSLETPVEPVLAERFLQTTSLPKRLQTQQGTMYDLYKLETGAQLEPYYAIIQKQVYTSSVLVPDSTKAHTLKTPVHFGKVASFLGYELLTDRIEPSSEVALLSFWRVNQRTEAPLAIFVHLLSPDASVLGQHDGLDVPTKSWYPGDIIVQAHRFATPAALPDGLLWLELGLYRTDTTERLPAFTNGTAETIGNRILLANVRSSAP